MANQYKENGESQPGIGYYYLTDSGTYNPVLVQNYETIRLSDGTKRVVFIGNKTRLHWMHPSILRGTHLIPGIKSIIEVNLIPNNLEPIHDSKQRN